MPTVTNQPSTHAANMAAMRLLPSQHNVAPPPNWRWERARWLRENGRAPVKGREDRWVCLAYRFQKEVAKLSGLASYERLAKKYGGLYWAWYWYDQSQWDVRWSMEAYLCAGDAVHSIAERVKKSLETVWCFSNLFFDVAGRTSSKEYMLNEVLGRSVYQGLADRQYDVLWKLYGMLKGPLYLQYLLTHDVDPGQVTAAEQLGAANDTNFRGSLGVKALYAARTIPIPYNQEIIFNTYTKLVEVEKKGQETGGGQNLVMANVSAVFTNLSLTVGRPDRAAGSRLAYYDGQSAELRANEMLGLAFGQEPAAGDDLAALKFPEATDGEPK